MAFTFDATSVDSETSTGLTQAHTCAATADLLVVGLAVRGLQTVNSITYAGAALTLAKEQLNADTDEKVYLYYKVAPATGSNNVVVSLSGSVQHAAGIASFIADNTPELDVTAGTGFIADTTPSVALSGAVGTLAVDAIMSEQNSDPPFTGAGGDQTILQNHSAQAGGSFGLGMSYELNPAAAESFDWTQTSGENGAIVIAAFKEVAGGGDTYEKAGLGVIGP